MAAMYGYRPAQAPNDSTDAVDVVSVKQLSYTTHVVERLLFVGNTNSRALSKGKWLNRI